MKQKSILVSILFLIFLEVFSAFTFWRGYFWLWLLISCFCLAAAILWAVGLSFKKWFSVDLIVHSIYLFLPLVFYIGNLFFLLLIQNKLFKQIFIWLSVFLFFIILMGIRGVILNLEYPIKPRVTYNFLVLSTIWTSFLIHSVIWAFYRDLNLSIWLIILVFFLINLALFYQIFHLFGVLRRRSLIYAFSTALVVAEFIWVLCFLPLEYFVAGLLITILFYTLWGLIHHQFEGSLNYKIVLEYLLVALIIFIFILGKNLII